MASNDSQDLAGEETIRGLGVSGQDATPFADDEIQTFAQKLQAWGDALPPREQELLARMVLAVPAGEEADDVGGYIWGGMWPSASMSLGVRVTSIAQDVTTGSKVKTADKQAAAANALVRG